MKLESYTPQIAGNTVRGTIASPNLMEAYGGNTSGMNAMAGALGKAAEVMQAQWMKNQNDKVIDATNEYNRQINSLLYDENTGLTNTMQGKDAEGMQAAYMDAEQKIRAKIAQQYGIDTRYADDAFRKQVEPSITSTLSTIDKYQRKGMEVYGQAQETENLTNFQNDILREPSSFVARWANTQRLNRAVMTGLGIDQETQDMKIREQLNAVAGNVLQTLSDTNDYKNGMNMISILRANGADEATLKKYENSFLKKEVSSNVKDDVQSWATSKGINLTKITKEDFLKEYNKDHPFTLPTATGIATGNAKADQFDSYIEEQAKKYGWSEEVTRRFKGMIDEETGGTWDPTIPAGNGDGGLGLLQFMPETAEQYGLTDRTDPKATIEAGARMFNDSLQMTGGDLDKATLMHNGGQSETGVRNAMANGYLEKVKEHEAGLYGNAMSDEQKAALQETRDNSILAQFSEMRQAQQQQIANSITQINGTLLEMDKAGNNPYQQYEYVESMVDNDPLLKESAQGIALLQGALNRKQAYENAQKKAEFAAKGLTENGVLNTSGFTYLKNQIGVTIRTQDDLEERLQWITENGGGLSPAQMDDLNKTWADYKSGKGPHAIDLPDDTGTIAALAGVDKGVIDSTALAMIKQGIYDFMNDKTNNPQGRFPDQSERQAIYQRIAAEHQIGGTMKYGGFLGFGQDEASLSLSGVQERKLGISEISQAVDADGNPTGFYVQSAEDGQTRYVTFDEMNRIKNHEIVLSDVPVER